MKFLRQAKGLQLICGLMISLSWMTTKAEAYYEGYLAEVFLTGAEYCPNGSLSADGGLQTVSENTSLYVLLGQRFGKVHFSQFLLPQLTPEDYFREFPKTGLRWCIWTQRGIFPTRPENRSDLSSNRVAGEILITATDFCPGGWQEHSAEAEFGGLLICRADGTAPELDLHIARLFLFEGATCPAKSLAADGALYPIRGNEPLFSLVRDSFGGNQTTEFAVPNKAAPGAGLIWCIVQDGQYPVRQY